MTNKATSKSTTNGSDWKGPQPDDTYPVIYFSGFRHYADEGIREKEIFEQTKWDARCLSYAYCGEGSDLYMKIAAETLAYCQENDIRILLDSGAFSFRDTLASDDLDLVDRFATTYAKWIKTRRQAFDFYVNLDYVRNASACWKMQMLLERKGLRPVPVFHGDSSMDWMRKYIDRGHKLIGLGTLGSGWSTGVKYKFYDRCFNLAEQHGVYLHGFAVTGSSMFRFPWHSVDSASWLKAAVFGAIILCDPFREQVTTWKISDQPTKRSGHQPGVIQRLEGTAREAVIEKLEAQGYTWDRLTTSSWERSRFNIQQFRDAVATRARPVYKGTCDLI